MNESTILRTVPAASELHKVPGFDPMKHLHKSTNDKGESVMRMEPRYQRLWFRLACPKGRMLLNPLRITDQLAIFEAKVFFHQDDAAPVSSYTANKTAQETPGYIQAAQNEALKVALDNAGFGIQLCDVTQDPGEGSSAPPPQVSGGTKEPAQTRETASVLEKAQAAPVPVPTPIVQPAATPAAEEPAPAPAPVAQTAPGPEPAPVVQAETVKAPDAAAAPTEQTAPAAEPAPDVQPEAVKAQDAVAALTEQSVPAADPAPTAEPVVEDAAPAPAEERASAQAEQQKMPGTAQHEETGTPGSQQPTVVTVLNFQPPADETGVSLDANTGANSPDPAPGQAEGQSTPSYTDDMPVEEICQVMTMEEAGAIVVPRGPCMGWTMAQVAERRPSSLRFFLTKFSECSNSQKAAATLLMQELEQKKAG